LWQARSSVFVALEYTAGIDAVGAFQRCALALAIGAHVLICTSIVVIAFATVWSIVIKAVSIFFVAHGDGARVAVLFAFQCSRGAYTIDATGICPAYVHGVTFGAVRFSLGPAHARFRIACSNHAPIAV